MIERWKPKMTQIKVTDELVNQLASMKPEQLEERFTPEERVYIFAEVNRMIEKTRKRTQELEAQNEMLSNKLKIRREQFLVKYGSKPLAMLELTNEDEVEMALFIDGYINIFPQRMSIHDGFAIMDLISNLLKIPDKRLICSNQILNYDGPINTIPLTPIDIKVYIRQLMDWLTKNVEPKPKKIFWPGNTLIEKKGLYEGRKVWC